MNIQFEQEHDAIIINLNGKLDSNSAGQLESELHPYLETSEIKVLFDLKGLEYISSAGMRILLKTAKTVTENQGRILFCNVHDFVLEMLNMTGFSSILKLCDDRETGIHDLVIA